MPPKKTTTLINFQFESVQRQITEAGNVVRWYPNLAFDWMEDAAAKVTSETQAKLWNKTARYMNDFVYQEEQRRYIDVGEFWGIYKGTRDQNKLVTKGKPRRLQYIEEIFISPEEWLRYV